MAASTLGSSSILSSDKASLQDVHETTPLLGSRSANKMPYKESSIDDSHLLEAQSRSSLTKSAEDDREPKTAIDLAGVIPVLLLGVFIANADGSIVFATAGTISSELDSLANASWIIVTYGLAMCAVQSMYGKLSDIYGRRAMLITAYTFFTLGCAMCGLGATLWQVVLGRAVAGLGGAGMTSLVAIIIADNVPLREVATWRSYVNVAATVGRSAGGPLGGFLADAVGWRWSFLLQCPLSLTAIILVAWKLNGPDPSSSCSENETKPRGFHRIDFLGSISLAITIITFLLALDMGGQKLPWSHFIIWILFASSAVSGILFLLVEGFVAHEPIVPLRLFVQRDIMTTYLLAGLQSGAQFGVMYSVPLYFQVTAKASVTNAGTHLVPAVFGNAIAGIIGGIMIKKTARYKFLAIIAAVASSVSYLLLILLWRGHTNIWESFYITPGGFGTGLLFSSIFVGLAASVDESQVATTTAIFYLSGNMGVIIGTSLVSSVLELSLRNQLTQTLQGIPNQGEILERALSDLEYIKSLTGPVREIIVKAYVQSFEYTHSISLAFSVITIFLAISIREHSLT